MRQKILSLAVGILASTFLLTACSGGSSDSTPTTGENYFGRTVPPEPTTSTSIVGVDTNNNNVRDDVERALAANFKSEKDFSLSMAGAAELQKVVSTPSPNYSEIEKKFVCSTASLGEANQGLIRNLVFNTPERQAALRSTMGTQPTSVEIMIDDSGNAVNPCAQ